MTRGALVGKSAPTRNYSIDGHIQPGQRVRWASSASSLLQLLTLSKALLASGDRHSGIVNVGQSPFALHALINLRLAAVRGDGRPVFSEFGGEVPIELRDRRIAENMD